MQVKLLRAVQEKAIKPVGGTEEIAVDTRILSATHKDLEVEVASGRFRQDLYYRLNVIKLNVPPLRERESDVLLLADYFLTLISSRWQLPNIILSATAKQALANYSFPGNVRELENILERASTLCDDNIIEPENLQLPDVSPIIKTAETMQSKFSTPDWSSLTVSGVNQMRGLQANEKDLILQALDQTRWNRTAAAKLLGMTFRQLRYRIKKYGLDQT